MTKPHSVPASPEETPSGLLRVLGPGMAMAMVVGNVIGAGIFLKPGAAAKAAGSFPTIFSAWVVGGLLSVLGALCFAELAVMLPQAGGMYVYLREAYGRTVGYLFVWSEFLLGRPASIAALASGVVGISSGWAGIQLAEWEMVSLCLLVIFLLMLINLFGVIWGGRVQGGTTIVKAGFLAGLALLPLLLMLSGYSGIEAENYRTTVDPEQKTWIGQFFLVLLAVQWSYNGWHDVTPVAEEVRDPHRNLPLSLLGGMGILIVIYLGVNLAYHGVLTMAEIEATSANFQLAPNMLKKLLGPLGANVAEFGAATILLVTICSMVGSLNANLMCGPRVVFAMSRTEPFARFFNHIHPTWHTPARAILVQGVMAGLMVVGSNELRPYLGGSRNIFDILTDYVIYTATIFFMLGVGSVMVLRWKHPEWPRVYRTWGYPGVPLLYLGINAAFLVYLTMDKPGESLGWIVLSLVGLIPYALARALVRDKTTNHGERTA